MPNNKARRGAGAHPKTHKVSGIRLEGRSVIVAMCVGQLGSLLPHVVVPSILAAFLIPEWHLSGAQAGLLAGSGAAGYMCAVPVLATLTDRIDARKILIAGSALSALGTLLFGLFAVGPVVGRVLQRDRGRRLCRRLHARPQGADRPPCAGRFVARDHALHVELLVRRRPVLPDFATGRGRLGLAGRVHGDGLWPAGDADGLLPVAAGRTKARAGTPAGFRAGVPEHARRWVSCSAMARTASSSTASGPGSSRSGLS